MDKEGSGGINIGTSLILVTFVLLSLVTFAALSYLSARSDYRLSRQAADRTADYYDANRVAELYMADIEGLLSKHKALSSGREEYFDGIAALFDDNDDILVTKEKGEVYISYKVKVTDGQDLAVSLRAHYPTGEDDRLFYIDKWAAAVNREWLDGVKEEGRDASGVKLLFE